MVISPSLLTHWGRVTQICVGKLTNIGSDNGLSPGRRQAIIWTNAGILVIGPSGINFSEFLIVINTFSFSKTHLKMLSSKWRPMPSILSRPQCVKLKSCQARSQPTNYTLEAANMTNFTAVKFMTMQSLQQPFYFRWYCHMIYFIAHQKPSQSDVSWSEMSGNCIMKFDETAIKSSNLIGATINVLANFVWFA